MPASSVQGLSEIGQTGTIVTFTGEPSGEWLRMVRGTAFHDFYHLPFYHELLRNIEHGEPRLFVYSKGEYRIILPLFIRPISGIPIGCERQLPLYDATSAYGYVGPISSHEVLPKHVIEGFRDCLAKMLVGMRVVTVFSRLHPFLEQSVILSGLGRLVCQGLTVSIDLQQSEEAQQAQYRENHRRSIQRLIKIGATCELDEDLRYVTAFIAIYYETMHRVAASEVYLFPPSYFEEILATPEAEVRLLVCLIQGEVAAGGLFVKCGNIVEYHLGGTSSKYLKLAPMKLVIDAARHWACSRGATIFHLGGGVGSANDSLAHFKSGFSNRTHSFQTWRWVLLPGIYDRLIGQVSRMNGSGRLSQDAEYFPKYRARLQVGDSRTTSPE